MSSSASTPRAPRGSTWPRTSIRMRRHRRRCRRLRPTGRSKAATRTSRNASRIQPIARESPRRYVRNEHLFTLEEAVRKATSQAADRTNLSDRGVLRPGMKADIVVFDPAKIRDVATYEDPHHFSEGIVDVIVNGGLVLRDGAMTNALPGRVLRGRGFEPQRH